MNILGFFQRLGRALQLPIAVLPVAALLLRFGQPDLLNVPFIAQAGRAIFDNLALIFAIGVASSWSKDNAGSAALAGAVGYFVMTKAMVTINPEINMGVLAGIITGLVAGGGIQPLGRHQAAGLPELLRRQTLRADRHRLLLSDPRGDLRLRLAAGAARYPLWRRMDRLRRGRWVPVSLVSSTVC